jgi:hypothetical protein
MDLHTSLTTPVIFLELFHDSFPAPTQHIPENFWLSAVPCLLHPDTSLDYVTASAHISYVFQKKAVTYEQSAISGCNIIANYVLGNTN